MPAQPSGLGWLPDGRMLVVSMRDARLLRREPDGTLVTHADLGAHVGGYPNDMVVDAQGRAYVGNFGFDLMGGAPVATAALLRVDPDGSVTAVAQDLWFPNGSVITDDGVLIVDETFGNRVSAFDIAADGVARQPPHLGEVRRAPDRARPARGAGPARRRPGRLLPGRRGRAVDRRRRRRRGSCRVREGGEIVDEIGVGTGVFACMLGGGDGRTLFACAAPDFDEKARSAAREGSLLAVRVDVPHAGRP